MKVRIGVGTGGAAASAEGLGGIVDAIDDLGFDSLWLSEVLTGTPLDPTVGLAWAAARRARPKLGTTMLLPGTNVVRLAKQLATLDALSEGRLLVTFVPGLTQEPESSAIGVPPKARGRAIEEAVPILRALWAGETVTHHGVVGDFDDVTLTPRPVQQPLEFWFGGIARASLERCGRLSDGWLPSLCTPDEAAEGKRVIDDAAAGAGRTISPEHFGVSVGYARDPLAPDAIARIASRRRDDRHAVEELVPVGPAALRALLERFLDVGFSKFVLRPLVAPTSWRAELEELADAVGDLQT
jgi:probable F420-dependent oxidoreductase